LDPRNLRDHHRDTRLVRGLLEIARHALLQVARLADVERATCRIEHPIDAWTMRQARDQLARVERYSRGRGVGLFAHRIMPPGWRLRGRDVRQSHRTRR